MNRHPRLHLLIAMLISMPLIIAAGYRNVSIRDYQMVERELIRSSVFATGHTTYSLGYPTPTTYVAAPGDPVIASLDFSAVTTETMDFSFSVPADCLRQGKLYLNLLYSMTTSSVCSVVMQADLWQVKPGDNLASLGAADATTTWKITPGANARRLRVNGYESLDDAENGSEWLSNNVTMNTGEVGEFNVSGLSNYSQDYLYLVKLTRHPMAGYHTGNMSLYRATIFMRRYNQLKSMQ